MRLLSIGSVAAIVAAAGLVVASPANAADPIPDTRFTSVAAGNATSSGVTTDGDLYTWGSNLDGQLGTGAGGDSATPTRVSLPGPVSVSAEGAGQTLALLTDGRVFAWGRDLLGNATTTGSATPVEIPVFSALPEGDRVAAIAAGDAHDIALTESGHVYTWGGGRRGALGNGSTADQTTPVDITANLPLEAGEKVTGVAAGFLSSIVVTDQGRAINWGGNVYGDLGDGTTTDRYTPAVVTIPGLAAGDAVVEVSLFSSTTLVRTSSGALYGWGSNSRGAVGDGSMGSPVLTPVAVAEFPDLAEGDRVVAISAGQFSSLALTESGAIYAWGYNGQGQLGDDSVIDRLTPVLVSALPSVLGGTTTAVSMGGRFALAVTENGEVFGWGQDNQGQLGDGAPADRSSLPVAIVLGTLSGSVSVDGAAYTGLTVTAEPSTAAGDWHPAAVYQYQWLRDGDPIAGAVNREYTLVDEDADAEITVQIVATAPNWASASATSLPVSPIVGVAPEITSAASASATAGDPFTHVITATGAPAPTITVDALPAGITFDAATGTLSGTFAASGVYTIEITATNGLAPNAVQQFEVTVTPSETIVVPPTGGTTGGAGTAGTTSAVTTGNTLAQTGSDIAPGVAVALLALMAGAALVLIARRRVTVTR